MREQVDIAVGGHDSQKTFRKLGLDPGGRKLTGRIGDDLPAKQEVRRAPMKRKRGFRSVGTADT